MESVTGIAANGYRAMMPSSGAERNPRRQAGGGDAVTAQPADGIRLPEDRVTISGAGPAAAGNDRPDAAAVPEGKQSGPGVKSTLDGRSLEEPQVQAQIARLRQIEEKVKAHEAAHKAVGGNLASSATYSYTQGPDGRTYITGGEVQIDMSDGKTPQETVSRMQQVIRAALAPADPSGQDRAVAAQAASRMAQAQQEKLQAESPTAQPEPARPLDTAEEAIRRALGPERGGVQGSSAAGGTASGVAGSRVRDAYGNPAVQGPSVPSGTAALVQRSGQPPIPPASLISSRA